ncbi:MAG: beta-N-acetylhexosaminidase [Candidatus Bathyarchaeia archaeon]
MKEIFIVPEPEKLDFSGKWFDFDGFKNLPEFLMQEFNVSEGGWTIVKVSRGGIGVKVIDGEVTIWGDEFVNYATLIQLVRQGNGCIPEVKTQESLNFSFRGYHLDIARGGVPNVETFKRILRWLFLLKYNYFAIYFEDLFPWEKHPQIGRHRGRLTREELREIIEYGKNLGIEVFPSLELSGHMEHILSLPEFRRFSEWRNPKEGCLDLSDEKAREFAYDLLREAVDFFPSRYIHIGGDETWSLGRGRSLNKTWSFNGPKLYEEHHRRLIEIVKESGKEPILWGDMISGMYLREEGSKWAEVMDSGIWKETLVANWDYSANAREHFKKKIDIFKDRGIQQIACPGLSNWNKYYPNFETALGNLKNFLAAAREEGLPGFLVTAWGDDGEECLFSFLEPLILAAIEIAEGDERWREKWTALTGEGEAVLKARILFGQPEISDVMKRVVFRDMWFHRLDVKRREELKSFWERSLKELEGVSLPEDLEFIRQLLAVGLRVLRGEVKVSDYLMLSAIYSKLWLKERKPQGLGRIVTRFWGAAGKEDMKL